MDELWWLIRPWRRINEWKAALGFEGPFLKLQAVNIVHGINNGQKQFVETRKVTTECTVVSQ
jgi:hypothetical protein